MIASDYQFFYKSAGFYVRSPASLLRVSGPTQVDFLQRQTTNDLHLLSEKKALLTVLTSPTARLIDVFYLLPSSQADGPAIDLISMTGNGRGTATYLKTHIFFMDRVSVADFSADFVQVSLGSPRGGDLLIKAGFTALPQSNEIIEGSLAGVEVRLLGIDSHIGFPYLLLIPAGGCEAAKSELLSHGATEFTPDLVEILRIEAGLPAAGHELVEAYTPLELNLECAVSDTKGCYTGQEVMARQRTYDKVTRKLVGLRLEEPVPNGVEVVAEDRFVGTVTSAAISPRLGPLALAVLRRPLNEAGSTVQVTTGGRFIRGVVTTLPFSSI